MDGNFPAPFLQSIYCKIPVAFRGVPENSGKSKIITMQHAGYEPGPPAWVTDTLTMLGHITLKNVQKML